MRDILGRKGVPDDVAGTVIEEFTQRGYLDDERLAGSIVASVDYRPRSRLAMKREMNRRGIETETTSAAVSAIDNEAEYEAARRLAAKRAPGLRGLEPRVAYRRLASALARRGFAADIVHRVTRETVEATSADDTPWDEADLGSDVGE